MKVLVVGAGPVTEELEKMLVVLGWEATYVSSYDAAAAALPDTDALIVTSHHDGVDGPILRDALARPDLTYIGAMGSRKTQDRRREFLGDTPGQDRIHGPAGLDIGAEGPPEIALSILAELTAAMRGRLDEASGSLRDRSGPIHPGQPEGYCPGG